MLSRQMIQSRPQLPPLHGFLIVDKPAGLTSHDVVARVRRIAGMKKVGHGGTLDPFATGVLPVALGHATRMLQFLLDSDKGYVVRAALGAETDTGDLEGQVVERSSPAQWPAADDIERALHDFTGEIDQTPPAYSAIKVGGRPLYERARRGEQVDVPTRRVRVYGIELDAYHPPYLTLRIACGKGTYIRSLVRDVGRALGVYAYCEALRRTQTGPFCLADAWRLDQLLDTDVRANWPAIALHPDSPLLDRPAVVLDGSRRGAWYDGRPVALATPAAADADAAVVRAYAADGHFVGLGRYEAGVLAPSVVLARPDEVDAS
jgi:tRNA pseudouridine55 synthase